MKEYTKPEINVTTYQTEDIMVNASVTGTGLISGATVNYNEIGF